MTMILVLLLLVTALGISFYFRQKARQAESAYLKNLLSDNVAESAVTGGPPEDMNAMPPDIDPGDDYPVYDGSDLGKRRTAA